MNEWTANKWQKNRQVDVENDLLHANRCHRTNIARTQSERLIVYLFNSLMLSLCFYSTFVCYHRVSLTKRAHDANVAGENENRFPVSTSSDRAIWFVRLFSVSLLELMFTFHLASGKNDFNNLNEAVNGKTMSSVTSRRWFGQETIETKLRKGATMKRMNR